MDESTAPETMIEVKNVSKTFKLPHEKVSSIKNIFAHTISYIKKRRSFEQQEALKNISFDVKRGEFFGIVGRNGSGKSTMLKLLAGIYPPTSGEIKINGKLTPFIELGVGFNQELTGRENVFLNGALLGFSRKEMSLMYPDIVDFAELEKFMDQKLRNYSSGMQVRLAFSIAIRAKNDILLLDEVLAVGDAAFQQKCFNYFEELKEQHKTVVFVSHDMGAVKRFCTQALYISNGKALKLGEPDVISQLYINENFAVSAKTGSGHRSDLPSLPVEVTLDLSRTTIEQGELIDIEATFKSDMPHDVVVSASVLKNSMYVGGFNTKNHKDGEKLRKGKNLFKIQIETSSLGAGQFSIGCGVFTKQGFMPLGQSEGRPQVNIVGDTIHKDGIANIDGNVTRIDQK